MSRRKGARAEPPASNLLAEAPASRLPEPLPEHPGLVGNPNAEVLVQVVAHGDTYRLTVNSGMVALWQRSRTVEFARSLRALIAARNVEHFVRMDGPDPLFSELRALDSL